MAAPKGNKYAVGNQGGRPPVYDLDKEAALLEEWSSKPNSVCLYDFTYDKKYLAQQLSIFAKSSHVFNLALNKAKERIARNRLNLLNNGSLHQAAWNRSASLYDRMLRDHEDSEKDKDLQRDMKRDEYRETIKAEAEAKRGIPPGQLLINKTIDDAKAMNTDDTQQKASPIDPASN